MIQRIQSVFILIYLCFVSTLLFNNVIEIIEGESTYFLNTWSLSLDRSATGETVFFPYCFGGVAQIISLFAATIAFFSYRNRKKQLRLLYIAILFLLIEWLLIAYFIIKLGYLSSTNECIKFKTGILLLLFAPVFLFAAKYFVKRDELIVHSSNRFI